MDHRLTRTNHVVPLSGGKMIGIYHQPGHYFRTESYQNRKNNEQAQTYVIVKLSPENIRAVRLKLQHLL